MARLWIWPCSTLKFNAQARLGINKVGSILFYMRLIRAVIPNRGAAAHWGAANFWI